MCARCKLLFAETRANKYTRAKEGQSVLSCLFLLGARISPLGDSFARSSSAEASFSVSLAAICSSKEGALLMYTPTLSSTGNVNAWLTTGASRRTRIVIDMDRHTWCHGNVHSRLYLSFFFFSSRNDKYLAYVLSRLLYGAAMARFNRTDRPIALDYNLVFSIVSYLIAASTRRVRISPLYGGKGHRDRVALEEGSLAREFRSFFFPFPFF